jgi:uncharacterized membrane protein
MLGPLQLIVVGFDEDKYARDIILELKSLRKAKTILLFDLLYLFKHEDGTIDAKEVSDLQEEEQREFGTLVRSLLGLSAKDGEHIDAEAVAGSLEAADDAFGLSDSEIQKMAAEIPNGSSAIFVIFEHAWARPLKAAMIRTGGYVRAQGIIDPDTLKSATNELAAVLAAVNKTEQATMEQMADTMAGAKSQEEEARARAAEAMAEADVTESEVADRLEEAARMAEQADQAAVAAQAREEAAREHAAQVAAEAEAMEDEAFAEAEAVRRAAERQKELALAEAAEASKHSQEIEAAAVMRAMNVLISARIIEPAATREALDAILAADVIEVSAARKAAQSLAAE